MSHRSRHRGGSLRPVPDSDFLTDPLTPHTSTPRLSPSLPTSPGTTGPIRLRRHNLGFGVRRPSSTSSGPCVGLRSDFKTRGGRVGSRGVLRRLPSFFQSIREYPHTVVGLRLWVPGVRADNGTRPSCTGTKRRATSCPPGALTPNRSFLKFPSGPTICRRQTITC